MSEDAVDDERDAEIERDAESDVVLDRALPPATTKVPLMRSSSNEVKRQHIQ